MYVGQGGGAPFRGAFFVLYERTRLPGVSDRGSINGSLLLGVTFFFVPALEWLWVILATGISGRSEIAFFLAALRWLVFR